MLLVKVDLMSFTTAGICHTLKRFEREQFEDYELELLFASLSQEFAVTFPENELFGT